MKKIFLAIFGLSCFPLIFSCCGMLKEKQRISHQSPSNHLILDSLICVDLSENLKGFSSGDDEVLLMTRIRNKSKSILGAVHGYTVFSKNYMAEKIGQRIAIQEIKSKAQLVIILLEQDSKRKNHELASIVDTTNAFIDFPKIDRVLLQKELGDDDLLDLRIIPLEGVAKHKSKKTKLDGIHLFDEYEYWLYWHLE